MNGSQGEVSCSPLGRGLGCVRARPTRAYLQFTFHKLRFKSQIVKSQICWMMGLLCLIHPTWLVALFNH